MWLSIMLVVLLLLLGYILFAPLRIVIDTASQHYFVRIPGILTLRLEPHNEELLRLSLHVFFRKFYFFPLRKRPAKPARRSRKHSAGRSPFSLKKGWQLLRTFTVEKYYLELDTGNVTTNAKLYSLYGILNYHGNHFHINYQGRNHLAITLMNRPINLIKSLLIN